MQSYYIDLCAQHYAASNMILKQAAFSLYAFDLYSVCWVNSLQDNPQRNNFFGQLSGDPTFPVETNMLGENGILNLEDYQVGKLLAFIVSSIAEA